MIGSSARFHARSVLLALVLSGCTPDAPLPTDANVAPRANLDVAPLLASIEPSQALYSERVQVTLRGLAPLAEVVALYIDTVAAVELTRVDETTVTATFEGGSPERVGSHAVTVRFGDGTTAALPHGFRWYYDRDPVVFVHGCPLPRDLDRIELKGSVTNYVTSGIWHKLYSLLKDEGYPAPRWERQEDFVKHPFRHPATLPSGGNYLNVFVLSEDSRDPAHTELEPPTVGAGHCGSGLLLAEELNAFVDEVLKKTGAERVDLVVNSGGALGTRWYLAPEGYGGSEKVRDIVFLAGMNHGSEIAVVPTVYDSVAPWWSPNYEMAREGFPAYACRDGGRLGSDTPGITVGGQKGQDLQHLVNGCFAEPERWGTGEKEIPDDHRGTPGGAEGVAYLSIYNALVDDLIEPTTSACLNQRFPGDCSDAEINVPVHAVDPGSVGERPHGAIRHDPEVLKLTACHLMRRSHVRPAPGGNCEMERLAAMAGG